MDTVEVIDNGRTFTLRFTYEGKDYEFEMQDIDVIWFKKALKVSRVGVASIPINGDYGDFFNIEYDRGDVSIYLDSMGETTIRLDKDMSRTITENVSKLF